MQLSGRGKTRIAFLAVAVALLVLVLFKPASPLAKWIDVGLHCAETGETVPDGLAVSLFGEGYEATHKTVNGHVLFGSGLVDGTYTLSWFWCEPYEEVVTINCSKITWEFEYTVPNPTIIEHYRYDTHYQDYPPKVGLNVSLLDNDGSLELIAWQLTDENGTVTFGGDVVAVCKDYYLSWKWGGDEYQEGPISFCYDEYCSLCDLVWEETNYLPAKSGRGR